MRQRVHVVQCGEIEVQLGRAVHTAPAAVTHRGVLYCSLVRAGRNVLGPARNARGTRKGDTVKMPTTGHVTSLKRKHPATAELPCRGVAPISEQSVNPETRSTRRSAARGARHDARCRTSGLIRLRLGARRSSCATYKCDT
jgi:hypothetical protein